MYSNVIQISNNIKNKLVDLIRNENYKIIVYMPVGCNLIAGKYLYTELYPFVVCLKKIISKLNSKLFMICLHTTMHYVLLLQETMDTEPDLL